MTKFLKQIKFEKRKRKKHQRCRFLNISKFKTLKISKPVGHISIKSSRKVKCHPFRFVVKQLNFRHVLKKKIAFFWTKLSGDLLDFNKGTGRRLGGGVGDGKVEYFRRGRRKNKKGKRSRITVRGPFPMFRFFKNSTIFETTVNCTRRKIAWKLMKSLVGGLGMVKVYLNT